LVFLKGRIGVISSGSVFIKVHSYDVLTPRLLNKYEQGAVIGYNEIDDGITLNS